MSKPQKNKSKEEKSNTIPPQGFILIKTFEEDYLKLSQENKKAADKALRIIAEEKIFTPSMRPEKLNKTKDIWSIRISLSDRITYKIGEDGVLILRRVGNHDVYDSP